MNVYSHRVRIFLNILWRPESGKITVEQKSCLSACFKYETGSTFLPQDYGGFVTLMMLKSTEKLIRCAAAQAPVIDWSMYGEQTVTLLWRHFLILRVGVMWLTRLLEMRTRSGFSVANQSCCVRICWSSQVKFIYVVPIHNKSNHKRFVISVEKQSEVWSTLHKPGRISLMLSNNNILTSFCFWFLPASAFSERYLGSPSIDENKYQVSASVARLVFTHCSSPKLHLFLQPDA